MFSSAGGLRALPASPAGWLSLISPNHRPAKVLIGRCGRYYNQAMNQVSKLIAAGAAGFILLLAAGCTLDGFEEPLAPEGAAAVSTALPPAPAPAITGEASPPAPVSDPGSPTAEAVEEGSGDADVLFVRGVQGEDGRWRFDVTVFHTDTGWEDYANGWDILTESGAVLKANPDDHFTRLLLHPHVEEQPFTRSQSGLVIPEDVARLIVRAHDLVDGWGGTTVEIDLSQSEGKNYRLEKQP